MRDWFCGVRCSTTVRERTYRTPSRRIVSYEYKDPFIGPFVDVVCFLRNSILANRFLLFVELVGCDLVVDSLRTTGV